MQVNNKLIIVTLILLSLFMIGTASAASDTDIVNSDVNNNEKVNHNNPINTDTSSDGKVVVEKKITNTNSSSKKCETPKKSVSTDENPDDKISSTSNNKDLLRETDDGKFSTLQNKIDNSNSIIELNNSYEYDTGFNTHGITINGKTITIHGNGYTLNGNRQGRIFTVINNGHLILENLQLINGQGQEEIVDTYGRCNVGGAIYANNTKVTLINTTLQNNTVTDYGGAIYTENSQVNINTSTLQNNHAIYGGAIYTEKSQVNINTSTLQNNTAKEHGGAIYTGNSQVNINTSTLQNNTSTKGNGGAIYTLKSYLTITTSTLQNNTAKDNGGAIRTDSSNITITTSTLKNNQATNNGGAIHVRDSQINITTSTLKNNTATEGNAGAIRTDYSNITITTSTLQNNQATNGGAIYIWDTSKLNLISSLFMDNNAGVKGSAIYGDSFDDLTVNHNIFLNNNDNVIYLYNDTECNFVYNLDYNWFGNTATNYKNIPNIKSNIKNLDFNNWLFLNATADPDTVSFNGFSNISFKLYLYNGTQVQDYDNKLLYPVNLRISSVKGKVNTTLARFGDKITYTATDAGEGSVGANIEDIKYTIKITNQAIPASITVTQSMISLNATDTVQIPAKLDPTGAGTLKYTSNDTSVAIVDKYGKVTALKEGYAKITISATVGNNYMLNTSDKIILIKVNLKQVKINKIKTKITAPQKAYYIEYSNKKYTVTLINNKKIGISNVPVTLKVNNKKYTAKTNKKGVAVFTIKNLNKKGTYKATITCPGNNKYLKSSTTTKILIKKSTPSLVAKNTIFNKSVKNKKYNIILTNKQKKPINSAKVTLKIGKKNYTAKTNKKGVAVFQIKDLNKKGTYNATINYPGNKNYNKASKKVKISIK